MKRGPGRPGQMSCGFCAAGNHAWCRPSLPRPNGETWHCKCKCDKGDE